VRLDKYVIVQLDKVTRDRSALFGS